MAFKNFVERGPSQRVFNVVAYACWVFIGISIADQVRSGVNFLESSGLLLNVWYVTWWLRKKKPPCTGCGRVPK